MYIKIIRILAVKSPSGVDTKASVLVVTNGKIKYAIVRPSSWLEAGGGLGCSTRVKSSNNLETIIKYWCYKVNSFIPGAHKYILNRIRLREQIKRG